MGLNNTKADQIKEIIKCGHEPDYFFKKYCKIQHPVRGTIPFRTFPFQEECIRDFEANRFNIVVKSRQLGLSTLTAAYAAWMCIFRKDQNVLIIATKQKTAQNMIRKIKFMLANLPPWLLLPQIIVNNKQELEFSNGSIVKAITTSEDSGRSEACSLICIDEAAFIKNFDRLWMGLYPTISTGGRAIIFSSPNGVGGKFYELYIQAEQGLNEFNAIKLPWDVHPERDQAWFNNETSNLSEREISQEYLCDFTASGDTFIGAEDIKRIGETIRNPHEKAGPDKNVWIWEQPKKGHSYILSADIAKGDGKDFSTFHIIDVDLGEVVAEYKGKMTPDHFAGLICEFGKRYNTAILCPENNSFGYAVLMKLRESEYPRLYYPSHKGAAFANYSEEEDIGKAGFSTNSKTRPAMLAKLEEVLRNKVLKIYSSRFYEELKTFVWSGSRMQAMKGHNDDLIMSLAIGVWLFDATEEYSQQAQLMNRAMLQSMGASKKEYRTPELSGKIFDALIDGPTMGDDKPKPKDPRNAAALRTSRAFSWLYS